MSSIGSRRGALSQRRALMQQLVSEIRVESRSEIFPIYRLPAPPVRVSGVVGRRGLEPRTSALTRRERRNVEYATANDVTWCYQSCAERQAAITVGGGYHVCQQGVPPAARPIAPERPYQWSRRSDRQERCSGASAARSPSKLCMSCDLQRTEFWPAQASAAPKREHR